MVEVEAEVEVESPREEGKGLLTHLIREEKCIVFFRLHVSPFTLSRLFRLPSCSLVLFCLFVFSSSSAPLFFLLLASALFHSSSCTPVSGSSSSRSSFAALSSQAAGDVIRAA